MPSFFHRVPLLARPAVLAEKPWIPKIVIPLRMHCWTSQQWHPRLSFRSGPHPLPLSQWERERIFGWSILTAALFVMLNERFQMAGEWFIGGVEAKGFAYVFMLLGLEALVRNRWNRAWLLFGAAAAFHALVGGWAVVAAGIAWLFMGKKFSPPPLGEGSSRPKFVSMLPGLLGGFLLSLPGLLPALALSRNIDVGNHPPCQRDLRLRAAAASSRYLSNQDGFPTSIRLVDFVFSRFVPMGEKTRPEKANSRCDPKTQSAVCNSICNDFHGECI